MYSCQYCPRSDFRTLKERDDHILSFHKDKLGSGYFESKSQTPDGDLKSLKHQLEQLKSQKSTEMSNTLTVPMPAPPRKELQPPQGWVKNVDGGYDFSRKLGSISTPFNITDEYIKSSVNSHHGICILNTFDKDLTELFELSEKEHILRSRMMALVVGDDELVEVMKELNIVKKKIRALKENSDNDRTSELILEEYWYAERGSEESEKQQLEFMNKVISECTRLTNNFKNQAPEQGKYNA